MYREKATQLFCLVSFVVLLCLSMLMAKPVLAQDSQTSAASQMSGSPLSPLPMASPRQTLTSFLSLSKDAENYLLEAIDTASSNDAFFDTPKVKGLKRAAILKMKKAASTLDLSFVAPENRQTLGINSVLLLKEVLERITVPPMDQVPGAEGTGDGGGQADWTLPGTEIRIVNNPTANGYPHFVFSEDTVQRLPEFYELVKALPQQTGSSVDFYKSFVLGPGLLLPVEMYRYIMQLPNWALSELAGQAVWQWVGFISISAIFAALIFLMLRKTHWRAGTSGSAGRIGVPFVIAAMLWAYGAICNDIINLTGSVEAVLELIIIILQAVALALGIITTANTVAYAVVSRPKIKAQALDASLIRLGIRVVGILLAGYILALAASRVGLPLYGIIASLGVGGLALALAVRPTLENFIGGIILYADKPVKVGDLCQFGSTKGTVETIGLRSTRVRAEDRTLVTVQNADFVKMSIINFSRRSSDLFTSEFTLAPSIEPANSSQVIQAVSEYLKSVEPVKCESVQVFVNDIQNNALKLQVRAYVSTKSEKRFTKVREELLLGIVTILKQQETAAAS
ncbi:MscS family membrane protein [Cohaesibacter sp. ES.047]|uniref:mechanosensitive ion channel family protein n=1 Tax=Cohaesibacter sp. ES.047 TaxID=1798205 RepID=UPI000BB8F615|nr:mechanosensitive ion channel domain-containing protein [Cohaesibacter sp. ES.047]SNY93595.1 MscS family membrane protein [Cohaesibacter sp. ES.047]